MKRLSKSVIVDDVPSTDAPERRLLSRKEQAREQRHAMYQRAKERQATDPRYLAMKEAVKVQRRATYQKVKEQRKTAAAETKSKLKVERTQQRQEQRAQSDRELSTLVTWMAKGSTAQN